MLNSILKFTLIDISVFLQDSHTLSHIVFKVSRKLEVLAHEFAIAMLLSLVKHPLDNKLWVPEFNFPKTLKPSLEKLSSDCRTVLKQVLTKSADLILEKLSKVSVRIEAGISHFRIRLIQMSL